MWLRAVHSFLISASITEPSPIWSSVSGYYASYYSVRAFAHLFGHFQLFKAGRMAKIHYEGSRCVCKFSGKTVRDHEHKVYWKLVKQSVVFQGDDLFTENEAGANPSDVRHRNYANYADHLLTIPPFTPPNEDALKTRIEYISKISLDTPPLPSSERFPESAALPTNVDGAKASARLVAQRCGSANKEERCGAFPIEGPTKRSCNSLRC
jgi:hypothetical protein